MSYRPVLVICLAVVGVATSAAQQALTPTSHPGTLKLNGGPEQRFTDLAGVADFVGFAGSSFGAGIRFQRTPGEFSIGTSGGGCSVNPYNITSTVLPYTSYVMSLDKLSNLKLSWNKVAFRSVFDITTVQGDTYHFECNVGSSYAGPTFDFYFDNTVAVRIMFDLFDGKPGTAEIALDPLPTAGA